MKYVIVCALLITVLAVCLVSCLGTTVDAAEPDPEMFTKVYEAHSGDSRTVYVHNDTGVMYFIVRGMQCVTMVVMVDAEGKPLIYTSEDVQE